MQQRTNDLPRIGDRPEVVVVPGDAVEDLERHAVAVINVGRLDGLDHCKNDGSRVFQQHRMRNGDKRMLLSERERRTHLLQVALAHVGAECTTHTFQVAERAARDVCLTRAANPQLHVGEFDAIVHLPRGEHEAQVFV